MSSRFLRVFVVLIIIYLPLLTKAQKGNSIHLISYRDDGRILLRWAPANTADWLELNKKGYRLERYTIIRNSKRVYPAEILKFNNTLRPVPLQDWEKVSFDNNFAAIAAQAIYGDDFQLQPDQLSGGIISAIQLSKEQDLRYSFTMLASDQSFEVAQMAGLGYEDQDIKSNESYMYKLYGNFGSAASDTAYTILDAGETAAPPKIEKLEVEFADQQAMLRWRTDYYEEVYSSYIVEKSEDGVNFIILENTPSIAASAKKEESLKWMLKSDTLLSNDKTYYYRIRGRTPFGIIGPTSKVVSGFGIQELDAGIGIVRAEVEENEIKLIWELSGISREDIVKHYIHRSTNSIKFDLLDSVAGDQYEYKDNYPMPSNYYKIEGINKTNQQVWSLPYFVQAEDSIPPSVPIGLIGTCDSTGLVQLHWQQNLEKDLKGYRVFRTRINNEEYRQVTVRSISDTLFYDSVELRTLSKEMYYKVMAVDNRGNKSMLSEVVLVNLTDIIPPVPPRVTGYKIDGSSVEISWINSSSCDVKSTRIFKTFMDSTNLIIETEAWKGLSTYNDSTSDNGMVSYYLTALDSSDNESIKSNVVRLNAITSSKVKDIKLSVSADRKRGVINLKWGHENDEVVYRLYRAKDGEPISLYKVFDGKVNEFSDGLLEVNSRYQYRMQFLYDDGGASVFSDQVDIVY